SLRGPWLARRVVVLSNSLPRRRRLPSVAPGSGSVEVLGLAAMTSIVTGPGVAHMSSSRRFGVRELATSDDQPRTPNLDSCLGRDLDDCLIRNLRKAHQTSTDASSKLDGLIFGAKGFIQVGQLPIHD